MTLRTVYTIKSTRNNSAINVYFESLTTEDTPILKGEDWQGARFGETWKALAEHDVAQKLTLQEGEEKPLLGMVYIGTVRKYNGHNSVLRDNLLEVAPVYRYGEEGRSYRGIGRVLVARLIAASMELGAEGRLLVRPVPSSIPFYRKLGFQEARIPHYFQLGIQEARDLLKSCTPLSTE